ncbi:hypothetical protein BS50DRAFT_567497 [Corynespora cassiicola Philippines]|uniref:Uncharacterized protein n=1 Tax=Corynespora cassiicola Philippines TaxID=1448308 RepID=A0A2T2PAK8_CORCC|nr:hypothetical protein BS50DRAFT_567497 [Corynespora cassiicola Philippines]
MILTSRKMYQKFRRHHKDKDPNVHDCGCEAHAYALESDTNGYFTIDAHQTFLAPPRSASIPAPFPSPSPAMEELGLNLLLPPPPPSPPPPQYTESESRDGLKLARTPTAIYRGDEATASDSDLSRIATAVRAPAPAPLDLGASAMLKLGIESPTASTSQCPTPRPQSVVDLRITPATPELKSPNPETAPSRFSPQSPPTSPPRPHQPSCEAPSPWTAELVDRTRQQQQQQHPPPPHFAVIPTEIPVRGKWVWIPDSPCSSIASPSPLSPPHPAPSVTSSPECPESTPAPTPQRPAIIERRDTPLADSENNDAADYYTSGVEVPVPLTSPISPQRADAKEKGVHVAEAEIRLMEELQRVRRRYEEWQARKAVEQRAEWMAARSGDEEGESEAGDAWEESDDGAESVSGSSTRSVESVEESLGFHGIMVEKSFLLEFDDG